LLGDSTLDNIVWVGEKNHCIKNLLENLLPDYTIHNYAADAFTTNDVLVGNNPVISHGKRETIGDPFPPSDDGIFFPPLEHMDRLEHVSHVVLSVGGNDIREILGRMDKLPVILKRLLTNYPLIVERILKKTSNLIIMSQYKPNKTNDKVYNVYKAMERLSGQNSVETLEAMMEVIYQPIFNIAKEHHIPIIDLSNTFDIFDNDLYESQIEPSYKGGQVISRLIAHVIGHHNFSGESLFYSEKGGQIQTSENNGTWFVNKNTQSKDLIKLTIKSIMETSLQNDDEGDEGDSSEERVIRETHPPVDEEKVAKVIEIIGINDRNKVIDLLKIDGTVETAITAFFS